MKTYDESVDRSGMRDHLLSFPEQVERSWRKGYETGRETGVATPRAMVWAGMGGSAIGGDYCAGLIADQTGFPMIVHRGGPLPAWVGEGDRVLLTSFSGNTAETLDAAGEAARRNAVIDVLTSGGELADWARRHGVDPWLVPGGRPPRAALGDLFAHALGAFAGRGWFRMDEEEIIRAVEDLKRENERLSSAPDSDGHPLFGLLDLFEGRLPMVYGTGTLAPVAHRWVTQINENAKRPAHWGELPEMNHNEVVAYLKGTGWGERCAIVLLEDRSCTENVLKRIDVTCRIAEATGWSAVVLRPEGEHAVNRMLEMTACGDWLSYWMAVGAGIDPTPIEPIDKLKAALEG